MISSSRALAAAILTTIATFGNSSFAADTGSIKGVVKYLGPMPTTETLRLSADPYCMKANAEKPLVKQDLIVSPASTIRNVIVHINDDQPLGGAYPPPQEPAVLDQRGCMYEPHVLALRVGQPLQILNSDKTIHNIHSQPKTNSRFNFSMISDKVKPQLKTFTAPELPVPVKCDVHPWMQAWLGVFDHPFFAVTDDDGTFEIRNVPPGTHKLSAWHEKLGTQEISVECDGKTAKFAEFTFRGAGRSTTVP